MWEKYFLTHGSFVELFNAPGRTQDVMALDLGHGNNFIGFLAFLAMVNLFLQV
jgi:hypothetical protein